MNGGLPISRLNLILKCALEPRMLSIMLVIDSLILVQANHKNLGNRCFDPTSKFKVGIYGCTPIATFCSDFQVVKIEILSLVELTSTSRIYVHLYFFALLLIVFEIQIRCNQFVTISFLVTSYIVIFKWFTHGNI